MKLTISIAGNVQDQHYPLCELQTALLDLVKMLDPLTSQKEDEDIDYPIVLTLNNNAYVNMTCIISN